MSGRKRGLLQLPVSGSLPFHAAPKIWASHVTRRSLQIFGPQPQTPHPPDSEARSTSALSLNSDSPAASIRRMAHGGLAQLWQELRDDPAMLAGTHPGMEGLATRCAWSDQEGRIQTVPCLYFSCKLCRMTSLFYWNVGLLSLLLCDWL